MGRARDVANKCHPAHSYRYYVFSSHFIPALVNVLFGFGYTKLYYDHAQSLVILRCVLCFLLVYHILTLLTTLAIFLDSDFACEKQFIKMDNCVTCHRGLRRVRRHVLSERFFETRREFAEYILQNIEPPQEVCSFFI